LIYGADETRSVGDHFDRGLARDFCRPLHGARIDESA
jgi:hypothetical protein